MGLPRSGLFCFHHKCAVPAFFRRVCFIFTAAVDHHPAGGIIGNYCQCLIKKISGPVPFPISVSKKSLLARSPLPYASMVCIILLSTLSLCPINWYKQKSSPQTDTPHLTQYRFRWINSNRYKYIRTIQLSRLSLRGSLLLWEEAPPETIRQPGLPWYQKHPPMPADIKKNTSNTINYTLNPSRLFGRLLKMIEKNTICRTGTLWFHRYVFLIKSVSCLISSGPKQGTLTSISASVTMAAMVTLLWHNGASSITERYTSIFGNLEFLYPSATITSISVK